jgi:hypothetical protein
MSRIRDDLAEIYPLREPDGATRVAHDVHRLGMFPGASWLRLLEDTCFVDVRVVPSPHDDEDVGTEGFLGVKPR